MLGDDDDEGYDARPKCVNSEAQDTPFRKGEKATSFCQESLKHVFRSKRTSTDLDRKDPEEHEVDDEDERVYNESVTMLSDSYVDFKALVTSPSKHERRFLRKGSQS
jgi:hypothetical protein